MSKKRKIPLFQIKIPNGLQFNDIKNYLPPDMVDVVWNESIDAIKEGIRFNQKTAKVFVLTNGNREFFLNISRNIWKNVLNKMIEKLSKDDKFEECIELQKLIKKC